MEKETSKEQLDLICRILAHCKKDKITIEQYAAEMTVKHNDAVNLAQTYKVEVDNLNRELEKMKVMLRKYGHKV